MKKNLFVVLEGVDGCGKTTVSEELALILSATLIKTPLPDQDCLRVAYDHDTCMTARYLFYLSCVLSASQKIKEILPRGNVICDRYLLSSVCYHKAMGVDMTIVETNRLDIIVPDFTFCLMASPEIRELRLKRRNSSGKTIEDNHDLLEAVQLDFMANIEYIVDTTDTSPKEAANIVASYLPNI